MIRSRHGIGLAEQTAHRLALVPTGVRAADTSLQQQLNALLAYRRVDAIEIVERLTILEGSIVGSGGLHVDLAADAKMFPDQCIAADAQEEAVQGGIGGASRRARGIQAGAGVSCESRGIDAAAIRAIVHRPETEHEIHGTLRAGKWHAQEQQGEKGKVRADSFHVRSSPHYFCN